MRRLAAGLFAAAIPIGIAAGACGATLDASGPSVCPLLAATGVPCPFCGMTRATLALGAGDLPRALALHPLAPLVLVVAFATAAAIATGRDRWLRSPRAPALVAAMLAMFWIAKLA